MSEQKREWVPGFIWVTPYPEYVDVAEDPILVPVARIVRVRKMSDLWAQIEFEKPGAAWAIQETPDQVAALIREEWRQRVMNEAIVQAQCPVSMLLGGKVDERVVE